MADLVVIVPSRGRPDAARDLADAFDATCTADTQLLVVVDESDPTQEEYERPLLRTASHSMVEALNIAARIVTESEPPPFAVGFCGDDHRPAGDWDVQVLSALRDLGTGMVYGDDGFQGERLPTAIFMTSDIVRALGYMSPPTLKHLYVDSSWLALGKAAGCIRYLPDVKVTHVHPIAQGLPMEGWDEGHRRVNSKEMYATDLVAFTRWRYMELPAAAAKIRALRTVTYG